MTRKIPAFSRFFEAMGYSHGELTNYANIARDCGTDAKTVKEYYQILCDTLLGRMVSPYKKRQERQVISKAPKFYLFDLGVANTLARRGEIHAGSDAFGRALEQLDAAERHRGDAARVAELMDRSAGSGIGEGGRLASALKRLGLALESYERQRRVR